MALSQSIQENLFIIHDSASGLYATIDPLFNFQGSMDHSDSNKKYTRIHVVF